MKEKKKVIWICVALFVIGLLIGACCFYFANKNNNDSNNSAQKPKDDNNKNNYSEDDYIKISDTIKELRSDLKLTKNAKVNSSKVDKSTGMIIVDIVEPDFQFDTHYLLCYDKNGNNILDVRDNYDEDNENNKYKYNGKFEYNENKGVLSVYTTLFLGESDEATGKAFNDKLLSELTKEEKKTLGNYSDEVRYNYKYESNKFRLSDKKEISKLKDNAYYKNILSN